MGFLGVFSWKERRRERLEALIRAVRERAEYLGIPYEDLSSLLREHYAHGRVRHVDWQRALSEVFKENRVPSSLRAFRSLVAALNELLGSPLTSDALDPPLFILGRKVRLLWAVALFSFVSYMVVGSILAGRTMLAPNHPIASLGLLAVLITILAVVEGLHLCIGRLGLKDLSALRDQYPRAYKLHKLFRTASGTNRFLAGRQLVVIVVVFFVARITSFSTAETWPLTSVVMPPVLKSAWFQEVFLNLGILGAFFVLWFGQLIPQFIATKKPVAFLNLFGMGIALRLCFFIERLGLTKPGDWFARWVHEEKYIPPSPEERYRIEVEQIRGFGTVGLSKSWRIDSSAASLRYQNAIRFARAGLNRLVDRSLVIPVHGKFKVWNELRNISGAPREIIASELLAEPLPGGPWQRLTQEVAPNLGAFRAEDVLVTTADIEFEAASGDHLAIVQPTMYLIFRATFAGKPYSLQEAKARGYRVDASLAEPIELFDADLEFRKGDDGYHFVEFVSLYPEPSTYYVFTWKVGY